ncbi:MULTISPECIES: hypothetical protein [Haloferax]|uniref:Pectate lyase superfamily protein domain-containing protein n=1 Tax=Haloferax marinum TaxID=2666143 RepID=A0A6A8GAC0_9EURY|nr:MULTISPECIES: hypothetical protein [Haloferax]KAB1191267.1 hypothetical protein Hfx1150_16465 [Haloferax sp. CBA1150]MRW98160.1 hypothetical protein [Haloferax marinum]
MGATSAVVENAAAAQTVRGITFDRVLNAADFCDTSGNSDCSGAIESRLNSGTLIKFPKGTYKIANSIYPGGPSNVGMIAEDGATLKIPANTEPTVFLNKGGRNVLFEGFTIDQTASGAFANMKFLCERNAQIRDIEIVGRAPAADHRLDQHILCDVHDPNGTSVIERFVAKDGGVLGEYRNSAGGIQATPAHHGTLKIIDCHIEEMSNSAIYATRNDGNIQIEGGVYRNNDVSQVRFMGPNSYVDGALIEIDMSKANNPGTPRKMRGVWIETKQSKFDGTKNGGYVRNSTLIVRDSPNTIEAIDLDETGGWLEVENCDFIIDRDGSRAITGYKPTDKASNYPKAPKPWDLKVTNCTVKGTAANRESVKVVGRPSSSVENVCIQQTASGRDGVTVVDAPDCFVGNSTINVAGQPVNEVDVNVQTTDIQTSGSCSLTVDSGTDSTTDSSTDSGTDSTTDSTDDSTTDSTTDSSTDSTDDSTTDSTSDSNTHELVIDGDGSSQLTNYEFTVSGSVEQTDDPGEDNVVGSTVSGAVAAGLDSFDYTGEITAFTIDGPAKIYVDGSQVDPASLGGSTDSTDDSTTDSSTDSSTDSTDDSTTDSSTDSSTDSTTTHELVIDGEGRSDLTNYEFTVSGSVEQTDDPGEDNVSGSSVTGAVGGGLDSFDYTGEITSFSIDGPAKVTVDGQEVDPATLDGSTDSSSDSDQTVETVSKLTIDGMGTDDLAHYRFSVSGSVKQVDDPGEDTVVKNKVRGATRRGIDEFEFTGQITSFALKGPARVYLDDTKVDPDTLG